MNIQRTLNVWLAFLTRILGFIGLVYELFVDKLHNPTALVVFGGLLGLPDVLGYRASVKKELEEEQRK